MPECGNCVYYEDGYCSEFGESVTSHGYCSRYSGTSNSSYGRIWDCRECYFYYEGYCGYWRESVTPIGCCSQGHV